MKGFFDRLAVHRASLPTAAIVVVGLLFAVSFARGTFWLPLMGDHCMKTSKNIEVAYNVVRYKDPLNKYVDFQATPDNPLGKRGSIAAFESPLSALALAAVYGVAGGADFIRRVDIARYFTLFHLLGAYLLLSLMVLWRNRFALGVFTFVLFGATFTVSYATKPLPETYAILYQGLFIAVGAHLLSRKMGPVKKSAVVALLAGLLSVGGKVNYFLIALPVIVGFPFFDAELIGVKNKLKYFAIFLIGGGVAVLAILLFTHISFYDAFVFMVKGNKPIINNSLLQTFLEGFDHFGEIVKRTRNDFGKTAFDWGRVAIFYLGAKLVYIAAFRRRKTDLWERFSVMTALVAIGHVCNYTGLRNLYIPHKYYVVPLYIIFALAITIMLADIRYLLTADFPLKRRFVTPGLDAFNRALAERISSPHRREGLRGMLVVFAAVSLLAIYLGYLGDTLGSRGWRTTTLLAAKSFGCRALAIDIRAWMATLSHVLIAAMWIGGGLAVVVLLSLLLLRKDGVAAWAAELDRRLRRLGIGFISLGIAFTLSLPMTFWILKNGKSFYDYAISHTELVENARDLAAIRRDTRSGDLVLAWKVCMAFYADKRSITDANPSDLPYYREHNVASVMGPKKPLHRFYKRIEKYPPPMSYWVPKERKGKRGAAPKRQQDKE